MTSRRFPRVPLNVSATLDMNGVVVPSRLLQVSQGGALFQLAMVHQVPDLFSVSFRLPGSSTIYAQVEGRHRRERGGYRPDPSLPTLGCRFSNLDEAALREIGRFIALQQDALRQLQFSLALMPPSPKAQELMKKAGVVDLPLTEVRQLVRWCVNP